MYPDVIFMLPKQTPALLLSDGSGLYRKEAIYTGNFEKGDLKFSVDERLIDHWVDTFNSMQHDGIEVPMPLKHTENPEARRATVIRLEKDVNEKGKPALYSVFKYRDAEAEKALKDSDISIYVPPEMKAGNGKTYQRPIRHIAFTDYPVIPDLGKRQVIAASLTSESESEDDVVDTKWLRKMADILGIDKRVPDDKLTLALEHVANTIMDDDEEDDDEEDDEEDEEEEEKPKKKKKEKKAISASFISMAKDARMTKLDRLVEKHCITPKVRDDLAKEYCSDEALTLALSNDDAGVDAFDKLIQTLSNNETVPTEERSHQQSDLQLSFETLRKNPEANPMVADAIARRQRAGQA